MNISKNHRYANPGLARQYHYETALVGTSHVLELESATLSKMIGKPGINLSISAGLIREQAQMVRLILRQAKSDTIFWEMNFPSFSFGDVVSESVQEFPLYFYTPTIETPLRYLM